MDILQEYINDLRVANDNMHNEIEGIKKTQIFLQRELSKGSQNLDRHIITKISQQTWHIVAKHSGKVFDVRAASQSDQAAVQQFRFHGGTNQQFTFRPI